MISHIRPWMRIKGKTVAVRFQCLISYVEQRPEHKLLLLPFLSRTFALRWRKRGGKILNIIEGEAVFENRICLLRSSEESDELTVCVIFLWFISLMCLLFPLCPLFPLCSLCPTFSVGMRPVMRLTVWEYTSFASFFLLQGSCLFVSYVFFVIFPQDGHFYSSKFLKPAFNKIQLILQRRRDHQWEVPRRPDADRGVLFLEREIDAKTTTVLHNSYTVSRQE